MHEVLILITKANSERSNTYRLTRGVSAGRTHTITLLFQTPNTGRLTSLHVLMECDRCHCHMGLSKQLLNFVFFNRYDFKGNCVNLKNE